MIASLVLFIIIIIIGINLFISPMRVNLKKSHYCNLEDNINIVWVSIEWDLENKNFYSTISNNLFEDILTNKKCYWINLKKRQNIYALLMLSSIFRKKKLLDNSFIETSSYFNATILRLCSIPVGFGYLEKENILYNFLYKLMYHVYFIFFKIKIISIDSTQASKILKGSHNVNFITYIYEKEDSESYLAQGITATATLQK